MNYLLLIVGFVLLVKGADVFVDGSSAIARYFHIPSFIIGLTIVAFGTSAPEAAVSMTAAVTGQNGIAVGNVLGSNIFNLLMVLGACSLFKPCPVDPSILRREYPLSVIAAILFLLLAVLHTDLFSAGSFSAGGMGKITEHLHLSRIDGIILLAVFAYFLVTTIRTASRSPISEPAPAAQGGKTMSLARGIILAVLGLAAIIIGGQLVVNSASAIAASFGVSQTLIGLTIVAIGTSLPELVTSIAAALKGETDIAVGNVIGSNLFNLLFVLGGSVTIHAVSVDPLSLCDCLILIVISLIAAVPAHTRRQFTRGWGILFILLYFLYTAYILMR